MAGFVGLLEMVVMIGLAWPGRLDSDTKGDNPFSVYRRKLVVNKTMDTEVGKVKAINRPDTMEKHLRKQKQ